MKEMFEMLFLFGGLAIIARLISQGIGGSFNNIFNKLLEKIKIKELLK